MHDKQKRLECTYIIKCRIVALAQWNEYNWKATWGGKFEAYHHQAPARKNIRGHLMSIYKSRSKTVKNGPKHF